MEEKTCFQGANGQHIRQNGLTQAQQNNSSILQSIMPAEAENAPALLAATEMHYTETFKNNQQQEASRKGKSAQAPDLEIGAGLSQRRKSGVYMLNSEALP